jgi:hypothetical protein
MKIHHPILSGLFLFVALASAWLLWVAFELRYLWYVDNVTALRLRAGIALIFAAIVLCWVFYPSRVAVIVLGFSALFFPPLTGFSPVGPTVEFIGYAIGIIAVLVLATEIRRRLGIKIGTVP